MALNNTYDARLVQQETAVGAGVQILLLALLGSAIGMGPAGWLTGLAFAIATWAVLSRALHRSGLRSFGPANRVTLGRATLVGGVTALVADSFESAPPVTLLVGLTAVALILDGVDGKVARRTGTSSALGARFDMEVDAFLILVLSVYVSMSLGPWLLLIGGMRYAFVAAARFLPWLNAPLPPSTARKTVAAVQGVFLLVAGADLLPWVANAAVAGLALGLLVWSFGRDVLWLWRTSRGGRGRGAERASGAAAQVVAGAASDAAPGGSAKAAHQAASAKVSVAASAAAPGGSAEATPRAAHQAASTTASVATSAAAPGECAEATPRAAHQAASVTAPGGSVEATPGAASAAEKARRGRKAERAGRGGKAERARRGRKAERARRVLEPVAG